MQQIRGSCRAGENRVNLKYSVYIGKHPRTRVYHNIQVSLNSMTAVTARYDTLSVKLYPVIMKMLSIRCHYLKDYSSSPLLLDKNL